MKKTWKIIKEVINKNKRPRIQDSFISNGAIITSNVDISEKFNDFFVNIGPTLKNKIPVCTEKISDYIKRVPNSIFLQPVSEDEIGKIVKNIKDGSPGWDEISPAVFKLCLSHILTPFLHICNLSLSQGIFPEEMKLAKVLPLYKSDDPMIFGHYRPVSVLPVLSKVLERIMYKNIGFSDKIKYTL